MGGLLDSVMGAVQQVAGIAQAGAQAANTFMPFLNQMGIGTPPPAAAPPVQTSAPSSGGGGDAGLLIAVGLGFLLLS